jgi:transposase InsO family protein
MEFFDLYQPHRITLQFKYSSINLCLLKRIGEKLLMTDKERKDVALFRYGILAPLITETWDGDGTNSGFFRYASTKNYTAPNGKEVTVAEGTIERWYYDHKRQGFDGLLPKKRGDVGTSRKLDDEVKAQIRHLKEEYRRMPCTLIHQKLIENGTLKYKDISLSTVTRYVNQLTLEKKYTTNTDMRRYEREHINEVWFGDSTQLGPRFVVDGKKHKVFIIALLDDASRYIVGIDLFLNDNFINLMSVMKSAVIRHGKPKKFNFDNGKSYKNKQMELLAARISSSIHYNPPYTPTGKAKLERWFRTMKDGWMSQLDMREFRTLDELKTSLYQFVNQYNKTIHASLNGLSPEERFFQESHLIKRLTKEQIKYSFLLELECRVTADCVITLFKTEYEVDYRFAKQRILVRCSPDLKEVYALDQVSGELEPIKLLDKHANAHIKREKVRFAKED